MSDDTLTEKKDSTIRKILEAATTVFADKGFAGARVDEIADQAGVNKATIYYHIGDKRALYARVLHDVFGGAADDIERNINDNQTPEKKIVAYARAIAQTVERHPNMPRIMMYEIASGTRNFPDEAAKDLIRMFVKLAMILEDGVEKGVFTEVNPFLIHFLAVGPLIFYKNLTSLKDQYMDLPEADRLVKYLSTNAAGEIEKIILKIVQR
ncbi:MAG: TetR/AcrR family transcriptional regulator [Deltaproteobacteria bacterium]|nr:TetR/AcrR family transcriptional regulator [Deltaproteobacteria bacterium]